MCAENWYQNEVCLASLDAPGQEAIGTPFLYIHKRTPNKCFHKND